MFAGPDWLEADERDLHGQHETHDVEGAVRCQERRTRAGEEKHG